MVHVSLHLPETVYSNGSSDFTLAFSLSLKSRHLGLGLKSIQMQKQTVETVVKTLAAPRPQVKTWGE